jgi:hypothetical protein
MGALTESRKHRESLDFLAEPVFYSGSRTWLRFKVQEIIKACGFMRLT